MKRGVASIKLFLPIFFQKAFTKAEGCGIIIMPNKLNIQFMSVFSFRDTYTLFDYTLPIEFDKMQIPYMGELKYTRTVYSLFGDDWSLCFCARLRLRTFCFWRDYEKSR